MGFETRDGIWHLFPSSFGSWLFGFSRWWFGHPDGGLVIREESLCCRTFSVPIAGTTNWLFAAWERRGVFRRVCSLGQWSTMEKKKEENGNDERPRPSIRTQPHTRRAKWSQSELKQDLHFLFRMNVVVARARALIVFRQPVSRQPPPRNQSQDGIRRNETRLDSQPAQRFPTAGHHLND